MGAHLLAQQLQGVPRTGAQVALEQRIPCQDGARPQHEGEEEVGVDEVASATQAPAGTRGSGWQHPWVLP